MDGLSVIELLSKLRSLNVILSIEGERLKLNAPAGVITPELSAELTLHKAEILRILKEEPATAKPRTQIIPRIPRDKNLSLSFAQQRLWFLSKMEGASEAYHIPRGVRLKGNLDRAALGLALDRILARHEALRTSFAEVAGEPVQRITAAEDSRFPLVEHDLRHHGDAKAELNRITELEVGTPFDLGTGPLIRGRLIQVDDNEHILLIVMHHIASDAGSVNLLYNELSALYSAFVRGEGDPLSDFEVQYADFAAWQRKWLSSDIIEQQASYWKSALAGAPATLELPTDFPRPAVQDHAGAFEELTLDKPLVAGLKEFSRRHRITPFMTLMAAWAVMLSRLSGQQDVLIGMPSGNRGQKEIEELIGFFVNTLVVRMDLSGSPSVRELLERTKVQTLAALRHQDIPFERVVALTHPTRSLAQSPLFQVMFAWQGSEEILKLPALEIENLSLPRRSAIFDLTLYLQEEGTTIRGGVEYATSLFKRTTIERYIGYLRKLLQGMIADDSELIDRLPMLSEAEQQRLIVDWNQTEFKYPREVPLAEQIEEQVAKTPDATAVIFGTKSLTYRELNDRANQLANELLKHGVGPDQVVGLYVERSTDLIVAMLAIIKSGAAYLPMDPLFPPDRLQYMLEDSGAQCLVTQQELLRELPTYAGTAILLEDRSWQTNSTANLGKVVGPSDLAYVIYTSGSTGKPKGVQIPRGALTNFLWSMREWLQFTERDRFLAVTTISFDIAGLEIWLPLLVGAQTIIASREEASDGNALRSLLDRHDITMLQATPVTWRLLFDSGWEGKAGMQAVCGGEAMPPEIAAKLAPAVKLLWNLYGPTETTIWSTGFPVTDGNARVLIGRPIGNTQCYILNEQRQLVPSGSIGELYIAGDGLARGYLNRPELTEEKFVPNPFSSEHGARMYRTGDLARYLPDSNIECLGRTDHQVKIRGYRIELGEIESRLVEYPGVSQAAVIAREDTPGDKRLVAYYTTTQFDEPQNGKIGAEQLRSHLQSGLPPYMVPAAFVYMEQMPLTPNGKLDRKALPAPEGKSFSTSEFEAPQGELETRLAAVWAGLLKLDRVGRNDNFFDLGGHSLLALQLSLQLQQIILDEPIPLRAVLEAPTVKEFAVWLQNRSGKEENILVQVRPGDGAQLPFFCVHGAGGNVLSMRPLAMALHADLPVYLLQAKGLDGSEPFETVEETAQFYVDEIRKVQPHGPYQIGGGCYGGVVAFEMARVLRNLGEPVAALVLIDSFNSAYPKFLSKREVYSRHVKFFVQRAVWHSRKMLSMRRAEWLVYMKSRLRTLNKYALSLVGRGAPVETPQFQTDVDWERARTAAGTRLGGFLERVGRASRLAGQKFVPKPYSGDAVIITASDRKVSPYDDVFLGWKPVVLGAIENYEVESNHITIFEDPAVKKVAEIIESKLSKSVAEVTVSRS